MDYNTYYDRTGEKINEAKLYNLHLQNQLLRDTILKETILKETILKETKSNVLFCIIGTIFVVSAGYIIREYKDNIKNIIMRGINYFNL